MGSAQTQVIAINNNSKTAGFYIDATGKTRGFTDRRGTFLKVDYPGTPFSQLLGQNDSGMVMMIGPSRSGERSSNHWQAWGW